MFAHEPLVRVRGPLLQAQIIETPLLNLINFPTLIATKAARVRMVPLRRIADPHAVIAGCVAFLLSPEARYVTGVNLVADGGVGGGILGHLPGRGVSKR